MNLFQKTLSYIHLRKYGITHKAAKREFNHPLVETDYYLFVIIACAILLLGVLAYKNEIDGINVVLIENNRASELKIASMGIINADLHSKNIKAEKNLVSLLNGSIVANGKILTYCQLDASGTCKL